MEVDFSEFRWPPYIDVREQVVRELIGETPEYMYINKWTDFETALSPSCLGNKLTRRKSLLIVVKSSPNRLQNRDAIRATWGKKIQHENWRIRTIFVMGQMHEKEIEIYGDVLEAEQKQFDDLLVGEFTDHYRNNTFKFLHSIKYAKNYCKSGTVSYVLLVDDDYLLSIKNLCAELDKHPPNEHLYMGWRFDTSPFRLIFNKHRMSLTLYPYNRFPPYISAVFSSSISLTDNLVLSSSVLPTLEADFDYSNEVSVTSLSSSLIGRYGDSYAIALIGISNDGYLQWESVDSSGSVFSLPNISESFSTLREIHRYIQTLSQETTIHGQTADGLEDIVSLTSTEKRSSEISSSSSTTPKEIFATLIEQTSSPLTSLSMKVSRITESEAVSDSSPVSILIEKEATSTDSTTSTSTSSSTSTSTDSTTSTSTTSSISTLTSSSTSASTSSTTSTSREETISDDLTESPTILKTGEEISSVPELTSKFSVNSFSSTNLDLEDTLSSLDPSTQAITTTGGSVSSAGPESSSTEVVVNCINGNSRLCDYCTKDSTKKQCAVSVEPLIFDFSGTENEIEIKLELSTAISEIGNPQCFLKNEEKEKIEFTTEIEKDKILLKFRQNFNDQTLMFLSCSIDEEIFLSNQSILVSSFEDLVQHKIPFITGFDKTIVSHKSILVTFIEALPSQFATDTDSGAACVLDGKNGKRYPAKWETPSITSCELDSTVPVGTMNIYIVRRKELEDATFQYQSPFSITVSGESTTSTMAPTLMSAHFTSDLTGIIIHLGNSTANLMNQVFDCLKIFLGAESFGTNSVCRIVNNTIEIFLGNSPKITPKDPLLIHSKMLSQDLSAASTLSSGAQYDVIMMTIPSDAVSPEVELVNPGEILPCQESVVLKSEVKSGNGGRSLTYNWRLQNGGTPELKKTLEEADSDSVVMRIEDIDSGATVVLNSCNFVDKCTESLPLSITLSDKSNKFSVFISGIPSSPLPALKIAMEAEPTLISCNKTIDLSTKNISYDWSINSTTVTRDAVYTILPRVYPANSHLTVVLKAKYWNPDLGIFMEAEDSESIHYGEEPLVAVFDGTERTMSVVNPVIIDASLSYDPNTGSRELNHSWSCSKASESSCDEIDNIDLTLAKLVIPEKTLKAGEKYFFTDFISNNLGSEIFGTISINVVEAKVPSIQLIPNSDSSISAESYLRIQALVRSEIGNLKIQWNLTKLEKNENIDISILPKAEQNFEDLSPDSLFAISFTIPPRNFSKIKSWNGLDPGDYSIQLTASNSDGNASTDFGFKVVPPLSKPTLHATPLQGLSALQTVIELTAEGVDEETSNNPVLLKFGLRTILVGNRTDETWFRESSVKNYRTILAAAWPEPHAPCDRIAYEGILEICDLAGSCAQTETDKFVVQHPLNESMALKSVIEEVESDISSGNIDNALQKLRIIQQEQCNNTIDSKIADSLIDKVLEKLTDSTDSEELLNGINVCAAVLSSASTSHVQKIVDLLTRTQIVFQGSKSESGIRMKRNIVEYLGTMENEKSSDFPEHRRKKDIVESLEVNESEVDSESSEDGRKTNLPGFLTEKNEPTPEDGKKSNLPGFLTEKNELTPEDGRKTNLPGFLTEKNEPTPEDGKKTNLPRSRFTVENEINSDSSKIRKKRNAAESLESKENIMTSVSSENNVDFLSVFDLIIQHEKDFTEPYLNIILSCISTFCKLVDSTRTMTAQGKIYTSIQTEGLSPLDKGFLNSSFSIALNLQNSITFDGNFQQYFSNYKCGDNMELTCTEVCLGSAMINNQILFDNTYVKSYFFPTEFNAATFSNLVSNFHWILFGDIQTGSILSLQAGAAYTVFVPLKNYVISYYYQCFVYSKDYWENSVCKSDTYATKTGTKMYSLGCSCMSYGIIAVFTVPPPPPEYYPPLNEVLLTFNLSTITACVGAQMSEFLSSISSATMISTSRFRNITCFPGSDEVLDPATIVCYLRPPFKEGQADISHAVQSIKRAVAVTGGLTIYGKVVITGVEATVVERPLQRDGRARKIPLRINKSFRDVIGNDSEAIGQKWAKTIARTMGVDQYRIKNPIIADGMIFNFTITLPFENEKTSATEPLSAEELSLLVMEQTAYNEIDLRDNNDQSMNVDPLYFNEIIQLEVQSPTNSLMTILAIVVSTVVLLSSFCVGGLVLLKIRTDRLIEAHNRNIRTVDIDPNGPFGVIPFESNGVVIRPTPFSKQMDKAADTVILGQNPVTTRHR